MRLAIIGSRKAPKNIAVDILPYVPADATEIVSGGAEGVDKAAEDIAAALSLPLRRFLPDYERYGKRAPADAPIWKLSLMPTRCWLSGTVVPGNHAQRSGMHPVQVNRCGWFLFSRDAAGASSPTE